MKKIFLNKKIVVLFLLFITASSFTTYLLLDFAKVRNRILESLFISELYRSEDITYMKENYPDTTILFPNPYGLDNSNQKENTNIKYVLTNMIGVPYTNSILNHLCGEGDEDGFASPTYDAKFKKEYGVNWEGKSFDMAQDYGKDDSGKTVYARFTCYNPLAIKAVFTKLYAKPDGKFQKISYKTFYNLVGKNYLRDFTKLLINLRVTQKAKWNAITADYLKQAKTNPNFKVHDLTYKAFDQLFPKPEDAIKYSKFSSPLYSATIGSLIRRECDGSLSAMIDCIKIILKDYDPEMYKQAQVL